MMKPLILSFVFLIIVFILSSGMEITFRPFKVEFPKWLFGLGVVFVCVGLAMIYMNGYREGLENGRDRIMHHIEELIKKSDNGKIEEPVNSINEKP